MDLVSDPGGLAAWDAGFVWVSSRAHNNQVSFFCWPLQPLLEHVTSREQRPVLVEREITTANIKSHRIMFAGGLRGLPKGPQKVPYSCYGTRAKGNARTPSCAYYYTIPQSTFSPPVGEAAASGGRRDAPSKTLWFGEKGARHDRCRGASHSWSSLSRPRSTVLTTRNGLTNNKQRRCMYIHGRGVPALSDVAKDLQTV
jgi:hypothetical protein